MTVALPLDARDDGGLRSQIQSFASDDFELSTVLDTKADQLVSVIVPARDESETIGAVIEALNPHRIGGTGLVDEILVVDDNSSDDTAEIAGRAGATVLSLRAGGGKGGAMAAGVEAAVGDLVVFLDGDVENTSADYVPRLLGPLLVDSSIQLVKGFYERPFEGRPRGGGRVTELTARPALALLFPELAELRQPLAGETAVRREVIRELGLDAGYRVEIALLIDIALRYGPGSIAEVDLGVRVHRNRPLDELGLMAREVLAAVLERSGSATGQIGTDH